MLLPLPLSKLLTPKTYKLIKDKKESNNKSKLKRIIRLVKKHPRGLKQEKCKCNIYDTLNNITYNLIVKETPSPIMFSIMLIFNKNKGSNFERYYRYHLMRLDVLPNGYPSHNSHYHISQTAKFYQFPVRKYPHLINSKGSHVHIMVESDSGTLALPISAISEFKNLNKLRSINVFEALKNFIKCNNIIIN